MRYKTSKSGAAAVDELMAYLVVVVFIVFIIIFVPGLIKSSDEKEITNNIAEQKLIDNSQSNLLAFLEYQHDNTRNSKITTDAYYSGDYFQIEQAAREFFNEIYQNEWILVVKDSDNIAFSIDQHNSLRSNIVTTDYSINIVKEAAIVYLPLNPHNDATYLEVNLLTRIPVKGAAIGE